jgi:hypothetical protein
MKKRRTQKRRQISEHAKVFEDFYGIPVPKGYIIHHIDGDHFNNDINNLQLVTRAEHSRIHNGWIRVLNVWFHPFLNSRGELTTVKPVRMNKPGKRISPRKEQMHDYYVKNHIKIMKKRKEIRDAHAEELRDYQSQWYWAHRDDVAAQRRERYAAVKDMGGHRGYIVKESCHV